MRYVTCPLSRGMRALKALLKGLIRLSRIRGANKRSVERRVCGTIFCSIFGSGAAGLKTTLKNGICTTFKNGFSYFKKCFLIILIFNKWGWIFKNSMVLNILKSNKNVFADFKQFARGPFLKL